jgi:2-methylcitrate dehydratase
VALLDGEVTGESFADTRLRDPAIAALMQKVEVREDKALSARYPEGAPGRVTIRAMSGDTHVKELTYPRGHAKNPMSDADVERKFRSMAGRRLSQAQCDAVVNTVWELERSTDIARGLVKPLTC